MLEVGRKLPALELRDANERTLALASLGDFGQRGGSPR
jgi:hypothetical protein